MTLHFLFDMDKSDSFAAPHSNMKHLIISLIMVHNKKNVLYTVNTYFISQGNSTVHFLYDIDIQSVSFILDQKYIGILITSS